MDSSQLIVLLADDDASDRTNFTDALEESRIKTVVHAVKLCWSYGARVWPRSN